MALAENMTLLHVIVRHYNGKSDMFTEKYRTGKVCQLRYLKSNEKSAIVLVTRMCKNLVQIIFANIIATNSENFTEGPIDTAKTMCSGNVPRIQTSVA